MCQVPCEDLSIQGTETWEAQKKVAVQPMTIKNKALRAEMKRREEMDSRDVLSCYQSNCAFGL